MAVELGSEEFWRRLAVEPTRLAAEVCFVDVTNLDATLQKHPSLRAWINAAYESARIEEERARWDVTRARALQMLAAKSALDEHTGKYKSVVVLEAEVDGSERVKETMDTLLAAQEKRGALRAMAQALEDRKDMLIQISAKQRQEMREYGA